MLNWTEQSASSRSSCRRVREDVAMAGRGSPAIEELDGLAQAVTSPDHNPAVAGPSTVGLPIFWLQMVSLPAYSFRLDPLELNLHGTNA